MADAGHLDDVVDAGVVVAAGGQHLGCRRRAAAAGSSRPAGAAGGRRPVGSGAATATPAAPERTGAHDVHALDRAGEAAGARARARPSTSGWRLIAARGLLGVEAAADEHRDDARDERAVALVLGGAEGPEQGDAGAVADGARAAGLRLVVAAGGLERREDRRPRLVQGHELVDPAR